MVSKVLSQKVYFSQEDREEIIKRIDMCLKTGYVAQGENIKEFEQTFAVQTGAKHAIALSSGGAAIETAMHLLNVKDQEVLVPTNTFIATAAGVLFAGGRVRFVDASADSFGVSLDSIKVARTPATVGVILVHIGGIITTEIELIRDYCEQTGLWLFEDCAHAHGSNINGRAAGQFGIMGGYSFFATKVITSGEGGMLITDDDELADRARRFRDYGKSEQWVSFSTELGVNRRMSEFCAIVGAVHSRRLNEFIESRQRIANQYTELLQCVPGIAPVLPEGRCSWYKYIVLLPKNIPRDKVKKAMADNNVYLAGSVYDLPLHKQPVFQGTQGIFPIAEDICSRHICLPIYYGMADEDVEYVVESLRSVLAKTDKYP